MRVSGVCRACVGRALGVCWACVGRVVFAKNGGGLFGTGCKIPVCALIPPIIFLVPCIICLHFMQRGFWFSEQFVVGKVETCNIVQTFMHENHKQKSHSIVHQLAKLVLAGHGVVAQLATIKFAACFFACLFFACLL